MPKVRGHSIDSVHSDWGFFEDTCVNTISQETVVSHVDGLGELPTLMFLQPSITEPPDYILDAPLPTQHLWYLSAGRRPQQPINERQACEDIWKQNFERSAITCSVTEPSQSLNNNMNGNRNPDIVGVVLWRGKCPFSNSVTKSFPENNNNLSSITIRMPQFRVLKLNNFLCPYAEFQIVCSLTLCGNKKPLVFGVWKRHSDFEKLFHMVQASDMLKFTHKNTQLSWDCVVQKKRWFKCLDKEYLSLKCFRLERFLHDFLFESNMPHHIHEFLGLLS